MIDLGALVTLTVDKSHPDGEELKAGVSGMVVQANPNRDGSVRYVVDFGSEGQWNCSEEELSHEGMVHRERSPRLSGSRQTRKIEEDDETDGDEILSFEEEMALLEGEDNPF